MNYTKKISSPIGTLFLIANDNALISLDIISTSLFEEAIKSENHSILNLTHQQLDEYFLKKRTSFDLPLAPSGTVFQQKAWKALSKIPFGKVWSYGEQAKFLKSPKASRAVGGANGKNPIPIIIPCHRVIGSTGKLIGYSGGMKMKIGLLKHEGHQIDGLQLIKN
ncbi:MAG: methylated-DNA--[protein]-cysteine S-methyltransferase [Bacteriovorax sp.]|nr:methylated-DNA--[protein]-cysteine S-methyltransferase [Bacteriovorax sp.]